MIAHPAPQKKMILGISLLKNTARFEWMLEKVTEIGITEIIPLLAERTERQHFRQDRFQQILVSACLQSGQFHFPILHEPMKLAAVFFNGSSSPEIHCALHGREQTPTDGAIFRQHFVDWA